MSLKSFQIILIILVSIFVFSNSRSPMILADTNSPETLQNIVRFSEGFDTVQAPQFPNGWSALTSGAGLSFETTTTLPDSAPNTAFAACSSSAGVSELTSPPILVSGVSSILKFKNRYSMENTWDGAVLEIKVGNGSFQDILVAGGTFLSGGYTTLLNPSTNPLANRQAWSGATQNNFITTAVQLPASTLGQNVQFRWRLGTNDSFGLDGWAIDSITLENVTTGANAGEINIPESGTAAPYPSTIEISGLIGLVTDVVVGLENFSHSSPEDVDILLAGPDGRNIVLISDVGGTFSASNLNLTLLDAASQNLPDNSALTSGVFKPTNFDQLDTFPSPAPQSVTGASLAAFFGSVPNGTWSIYVVDDNGNNAGTVSGGWNLSIKTSTTACLPSITPNAQSFPSSGGIGRFSVGASGGCGWNVSTANPFVAIQSPANGVGHSNVDFSVAPNSGAARTGLITITDGFNPRTFQIQQSAGCPTSLGTSALNFQSTGGTGNVSVTANGSCIWNSFSKVNWVEITSGQQSGNGSATFTVLPNTSGIARSTTISVGVRSLTVNQTAGSSVRFDFDGDGRSDISVYRNGVWHVNQSSNGAVATQFGLSSDKLTPADFDGDRKADIAVFRNGVWYILQSSNSQIIAVQFGVANDIPVPADFDGDGRADLGIFRTGDWYLLNLATNQSTVIQFGLPNDKPVVADYDGDGKADLAVYRDGIWFLQRSNLGFLAVQFGLSTDKPIVGDFNGDGRSDLSVFRSGVWHVLTDFQNYSSAQFGIASDLPVAADYDGDGKTDFAVFRDGVWYLLRTTLGLAIEQFGLPNDRPVPNTFVP